MNKYIILHNIGRKSEHISDIFNCYSANISSTNQIADILHLNDKEAYATIIALRRLCNITSYRFLRRNKRVFCKRLLLTLAFSMHHLTFMMSQLKKKQHFFCSRTFLVFTFYPISTNVLFM